jgi:hypothetical protein
MALVFGIPELVSLHGTKLLDLGRVYVIPRWHRGSATDLIPLLYQQIINGITASVRSIKRGGATFVYLPWKMIGYVEAIITASIDLRPLQPSRSINVWGCGVDVLCIAISRME